MLAVALVLRVGEELVWPIVKQIPLGAPIQMPALLALMACVILVPILFFTGGVFSLIGLVNLSKKRTF